MMVSELTSNYFNVYLYIGFLLEHSPAAPQYYNSSRSIHLEDSIMFGCILCALSHNRLKAMAPVVAKDYCRFQDLVYDVIIPSSGDPSPLGSWPLIMPRAPTLHGLVLQQFACPSGKQMGQVTSADILLYLRSYIGLTP
jgi:hypothetical protein